MFASEKGLTLIELVMVIIVIGILAGVAMKSMDSAIETGRIESTKKEMNVLAMAIAGNPDLVNNGSRTDYGYVGDVGSLPPDLDALVTAPTAHSTWKGPYVSSNFMQSADDYKKDAWGALYTYSGDITITSTGSGSNITRKIANAVPELTGNTIRGAVMDAQGIPPGPHSDSVNIIMTYPDGGGLTTTSSINPSPSGNYNFTGIPIGNHIVAAVNLATHDTLISYVSVSPRSVVINNIRFGYALWGDTSGGGPGPTGGLQYMSGSATTTGGGADVEFQISNNSGAAIMVNWLEATYTHAPTAYYERVRWGSGSVAFQPNPMYGSGDKATFSSSKTLDDGSTETIKLQGFSSSKSGAGSSVNMTGSSFTVSFSDGSVITFAI